MFHEMDFNYWLKSLTFLNLFLDFRYFNIFILDSIGNRFLSSDSRKNNKNTNKQNTDLLLHFESINKNHDILKVGFQKMCTLKIPLSSWLKEVVGETVRYVAKGMATAKLMCASAISQGSYVREFKRVERGKNIDVGAEGQKKDL